MITVFYDGKCGLCRREIEHYQRIASAGVFEWVDITVTPALFTALGLSVSDGLKVLHVRSEDGALHKGMDAFTAIWQALPPRWRVLGYIAGLPIIRLIMNSLYGHFAKWRFKHLGYDKCDL
ncbi:MAG: thiol-disulfide oxidoreductase DCC family protein [Methylovulum sp.]